MKAQATCPYCGARTTLKPPGNVMIGPMHGKTVMVCEGDSVLAEGRQGCAREYVADWEYSISIWTRKIEQQEEAKDGTASD